MKEIKIKTGSNLSAILQSTVNLPQAFTELVKNSLQNFGTFVDITIEDDKILVEDDGKSFDDIEDTTGKNDFDKYFVFGNSYDTTSGNGIRLGHMGIGGKLANDKLSTSGAPNWSLHCKNKNKKAFIVNYNPDKNEFLDDYSPEVTEINYDKSLVKSDTGTLIVINEVNPQISKPGVFNNIKNELKTFFGFLVGKLAEENKKFKITFNGESLDFDYRLPGNAFGHIKKSFDYDLYGETKTSEIEFKLSMIKDRSLIENHPLQGIEIISQVKICDFNLSDNNLIEKVYKNISEKEGKDIAVQSNVLNLFRNLIGFVSCPDLSSVLDDTGMPAKDLSHHNLRDDHPITQPFLEKCYEIIIEMLRTYIDLEESKKDDKFQAIIAELTKLLDEFEDLDDNLLMDLEVDDGSMIQDAAIQKAVERGMLVPPQERTWEDKAPDLELPPQEDEDDDDKEDDDSGDQEDSPNTIKVLNYEILDFGSGFETEMSRIAEMDGFKILINSGNHKFLKLDAGTSPLMMSMHIAECLITEVTEYVNPFITVREIQSKISNFYADMYDEMLDKFSL